MSGENETYMQFSEFFSTVAIAEVFKSSVLVRSTRGVDGETPGIFLTNIDNNFNNLADVVLSGSYKLTRFREKLILKGAKERPRQVFIPTVRDRLVLRCLHNYLSSKFPTAKTPLPHDCIKAIKTRLKSVNEDDCFLRVDIKNFYPSIRHSSLMKEVAAGVSDKRCQKLVRNAITTTAFAHKRSARGVPQGLSISNCLANIMLSKVDAELHQKFGVQNYYRYVDDIVILTKQVTASSDFLFVAAAMKEVGLSVHKMKSKSFPNSKSQICSLAEGVEYLGFKLTATSVSVRKSSLKRIYDRIAGQITSLKYGGSFSRFGFKLELTITGCILDGKRFGWLHFFQQSEDIGQLACLDRFIHNQLKKNSKIPQGYKPKTFVKAYHEIRFRAASTTYIPNFDVADMEYKKETLVKFGNTAGIEGWTVEEIEKRFFALVTKLAHELEQDVLGATS